MQRSIESMMPVVALFPPERMPWIDASVLLTVPGLDWLEPSLLAGKTVRQLTPGQIDHKGLDISEFFVLVDVGTAVLYPVGSNSRPWVMNSQNVNCKVAPTLTYIASGHSSGAMLAVAHANDLPGVFQAHPKMKELQFAREHLRPAGAPPGCTAIMDNQGMIRVPASVLQALPGFGDLDDTLFKDKTLRQIGRGQVDEEGCDISGFFVVSDAGWVLLFTEHGNAARWANSVNVQFAPSLTYVNSGNSQGGKIAVVNSTDLIKLLMMHPKMKTLVGEAAEAFVQRETGAVAGMVRAMEAAAAPTDGQRMLQHGSNDATAGAESREQTNYTTSDGYIHTERIVERVATLPDGQSMVIQQAQHVVQVPVVDQNMLLGAITASRNDLKQDVQELKKNVITHVNRIVDKEGDARKKGDSNAKAMFRAKFKAQATLFNAANKANKAKNKTLEKRLAALEAGSAGNKKVCLARSDANIIKNHVKNTFGWKKTRHGVTDSSSGFATVKDAQKDMALFYG